MPTPTRTLHPLPFEHLEPRRFEDLVRQLAYEFRNWRALEATGRSGRDEGYDIRGWEVVPEIDAPPQIDDNDSEEPITYTPPESDREWLFQCKRTQRIGPKKLENFLNEIGEETLSSLYGLVYATSSDLSKASRDVFRSWCRIAGLAECYIWSRGELEDMLFQPKNDGLLFAYFGISLKIKQRLVRTELRSRLATKRKAFRAFGNESFLQQDALFRDPEEKRYPYISNGADRADHRWRVMTVMEHHPLGIIVQRGRFFAFLDEDNFHWDIADAYNEARDHNDDPWMDTEEQSRIRESLRHPMHEFWYNEIDEKCRGWLEVTALLRFEDMIEIDPDGDSMFSHPHIYVSFLDKEPAFSGSVARLTVPEIRKQREDNRYELTAQKRQIYIQDFQQNRVSFFPNQFRKPPSGS